jgi:hypothetical protein
MFPCTFTLGVFPRVGDVGVQQRYLDPVTRTVD